MESRQIVFDSRSENIVLIEKLIDEVCEEFKVNEDFYGNMLVALTEAVNNAIQHGNKSNPSKKVKVFVENQNEGIIFRVKDEGEGFDYAHIPDPTDPENIEKPNGRGVFLMRNLADNVDFSDNGKTVELMFRIFKN